MVGDYECLIVTENDILYVSKNLLQVQSSESPDYCVYFYFVHLSLVNTIRLSCTSHIVIIMHTYLANNAST